VYGPSSWRAGRGPYHPLPLGVHKNVATSALASTLLGLRPERLRGACTLTVNLYRGAGVESGRGRGPTGPEEPYVRMRIRVLALAAALAASAGSAIGDERWPEDIVDDAGALARPRGGPRDPVPNFGVVWERKLTRSGQPRSPAGWTWLRRQGVRSIVNFRTEKDDYRGVGFEHVLWLPFKKSQPPKDADAGRFLAFVRDPQNWPVHIHCRAGRSRTGMMAAFVRYAIDGWPLGRALAEARSYRKGSKLAPQYIAWLRRWAAGHEPGSHRRGTGQAAGPADGMPPASTLP